PWFVRRRIFSKALHPGASVPVDVLHFTRIPCADHSAAAGTVGVDLPVAAGGADQPVDFPGRVRRGGRASRFAQEEATKLVSSAGRVALSAAADRARLGTLQLAADRALRAAGLQTCRFAGTARRPGIIRTGLLPVGGRLGSVCLSQAHSLQIGIRRMATQNGHGLERSGRGNFRRPMEPLALDDGRRGTWPGRKNISLPTECHLVAARANRLLVRVRRGTAADRSPGTGASLDLDGSPFAARVGVETRAGETEHAALD